MDLLERQALITPQVLSMVDAMASNVAAACGLSHERDELMSQAHLETWELALAFDPDLGVPFGAYVTARLRFRLIDWLRRTRGRVVRGVPSSKMQRMLETFSLDAFDDDDRREEWLPRPGPSVEDIVEGRDEFERLLACIAEWPELRQRALLWPVTEGSAESLQRDYVLTKSRAATHRYYAKSKAYKLIGRPEQRRTRKAS